MGEKITKERWVWRRKFVFSVPRAVREGPNSNEKNNSDRGKGWGRKHQTSAVREAQRKGKDFHQKKNKRGKVAHPIKK